MLITSPSAPAGPPRWGDIGVSATHFVPSFVSYVISFLLAPLEVVVAEHVVVAVSAEGAGVAAG